MATRRFGQIKSNNPHMSYDDVTGEFAFDGINPTASSTPTVINAKSAAYGATGDGVTDDSTAIAAAVTVAIANNSEIYIPAGTYVVGNNVFSSFTGSSQTGLKISGDGIGSTIIKFADPGAGDVWFYDNGASTPKLERPTFRDIQFQGFSEAKAAQCNGFKIWSSGHEKDFKFIRCRFLDMGTIAHAWGTANGDHFGFMFCAFENTRTRVLYLDNPQSVCHSFFGCTHYGVGDVFHIIQGGSVQVSGGSYNLYGSGYFLHFPVGSTVGGGNDGFYFSGVRIEHNHADASLLRMETNARMIHFDGCNIFTNNPTVYAGKVGVYMKEAGACFFTQCYLPDWAYTIDDGAVSYTYGGPMILFDRCCATQLLSERINVTTNVGRVRAVNMIPPSTTPGPPYTTFTPLDFDFNWRNTPLQPFSPPGAFRATLKPTLQPWPKSGGNEYTLVIPRTIKGGGARLRSIHLYKPAEGSSVNLVVYKVGNQAKTVVYAETAEDYVKNEIELHADVDVDLADADRDILLWAVTDDTVSYSTGYGFVEYD